jgi:hypothetical protein
MATALSGRPAAVLSLWELAAETIAVKMRHGL